MEALIADLTEDTQQKTDVGMGPNPVQDSNLEIATSKTTGGENSIKGNEVRPGDELVAEVDYPNPQTLAKPDRSMASLSTLSCPSCSFAITCWTMKLAKQI